MKTYKILLVIILFTTQTYAQSESAFFNLADAFFKKNVVNGKVNYASIHANQKELNQVLALAASFTANKNESQTYQAFWINAYNISVIKGLINHFPTKSPLDHAGFFDKTTYNLAGIEVTLNQIENDLLRANFKDPRFHFALVCGAIGCPPLINEAYLPSTLDTQLESQTILALNADYFIKVNTKKKKVEGSEILKWYKEDFTQNGKTEIDFFNIYRTEKISNDYTLTYFPYNWKINQQ